MASRALWFSDIKTNGTDSFPTYIAFREINCSDKLRIIRYTNWPVSRNPVETKSKIESYDDSVGERK